jgi:hypothetical protein
LLPVPRAGRLLIFRLAVVGEMVGMADVVAALSVASELQWDPQISEPEAIGIAKVESHLVVSP